MVATLVDLSRRGDTGGFVVPQVFAAADALLRTWMVAANAQNTSQELSILTGPGETAGFCGWTIKARLALLNLGQPVELMSQWVANLTTGAVTVHGAPASGFTGGGALGGHGMLIGGVGTTNSLITLLPQPLPVGAVVASSLAADQEYFAFAFTQHTFSNRQAVVLLIAKDVYSGQWHLSFTDMAGAIGAVAWIANRPGVVLSNSIRLDYFSSATPLMLTQPVQWNPITPGITAATPPALNPPVQWFDPVVLPADLALYNRTSSSFGYFIGAEGTEWLQLGPARLAVKVKEGGGD
ncbi:hypothetical protein KBY93_15040 [Synechococcus sp. J7-Johnson]|uniref:hypothetical protein n=1 Tax=Synechococcus sp. J7-Johnson TaxID=2823737 RepID=UPI0020CE167D|nr:hypothetical protein [Synechococcus sp. J7-Johnson]MCP9841930.1 hypothetical protein [Synechococcus sp. J7-Johnson]